MPDDVEGLLATVHDYFDAIYHGDVDALRRAMHPRARLMSIAEGDLVELDLDHYVERIEGRPSPASRNDERDDRILSLSVASATTAHARVRDVYPPKRFTDDLTLIRTAERWQIIAKVWHVDQ